MTHYFMIYHTPPQATNCPDQHNVGLAGGNRLPTVYDYCWLCAVSSPGVLGHTALEQQFPYKGKCKIISKHYLFSKTQLDEFVFRIYFKDNEPCSGTMIWAPLHLLTNISYWLQSEAKWGNSNLLSCI